MCCGLYDLFILLNKMTKTYLDPSDRHFRWPGMNLDALDAVRRIEPDDFAGDKFNEANALGSGTDEVAAAADWNAGVTDSFELHDDELGTDDGGSSFNDFLL